MNLGNKRRPAEAAGLYLSHRTLRRLCLRSRSLPRAPLLRLVGRTQPMGTSLEGPKMSPDLTFDGTAKNLPVFKQNLLKYTDSQGFAYMLAAEQSICTIFQAASATAAKSKTTRGSAAVAGSGTISLDLETYDGKVIKDEFKRRRLSSRALLWQCVETASTS